MTSTSAGVCEASKTFWLHLWESLPRLFLLREEHLSSWATDCCFRGCGWFTRNGTCSRLIVRSCSLVALFEQRLVALAHWMPRLCACVMIAEALTEICWFCCASMGFVLEVIGDTFANACYAFSSLELDSPQTSRSRHRTKRWTTVLSVLAQADW